MAALVLLAACSSTIADLPGPVGLPAGTPARPADPPLYPAVHDMPPDRPTEPMTAEQVKKAEQDLITARERQEKRSGVKPAKSKPKRPPTEENPTAAAGTAPNP